MLTTRIAGIPCQVEIVSYSPYRDNCTGHIDSWLPDEHEELEFQVYDTKGYPAEWLAVKMTDSDISRIEKLLIEELSDEV